MVWVFDDFSCNLQQHILQIPFDGGAVRIRDPPLSAASILELLQGWGGIVAIHLYLDLI